MTTNPSTYFSVAIELNGTKIAYGTDKNCPDTALEAVRLFGRPGSNTVTVAKGGINGETRVFSIEYAIIEQFTVGPQSKEETGEETELDALLKYARKLYNSQKELALKLEKYL